MATEEEKAEWLKKREIFWEQQKKDDPENYYKDLAAREKLAALKKSRKAVRKIRQERHAQKQLPIPIKEAAQIATDCGHTFKSEAYYRAVAFLCGITFAKIRKAYKNALEPDPPEEEEKKGGIDVKGIIAKSMGKDAENFKNDA